MKSKLICSSLVAISILIVAPASAALKIGMITTLTTKAGYLGEDIRDGFQLAIEMGGGKLGGVDIELLVEDDGRKPGKGLQISERYIKSDKVKIKILNIDLEHQRVGLSLKRLKPNPWSTVESHLKPGDVVAGSVAGVDIRMLR